MKNRWTSTIQAFGIIMSVSIGIWSCATGSDDSVDIGQNAMTSECGGFVESQLGSIRAALISESDTPDAAESEQAGTSDCEYETLNWSYDEQKHLLSIVDRYVLLNCCGEHSIRVFYDQETESYEIAERDDAWLHDGEPSRCSCMCFFDYSIDIPEVDAERISIRLTLTVSDSDSAKKTVWEGELDLSEGAGRELIKENDDWCDY